jgi:hypothetical protein
VHEECNEHQSPIFLHHAPDNDVIQIVRTFENHAKEDYDSYCVIARCNFNPIDNDTVDTTLELPGKIEKIIVCAYAEFTPEDVEKYMNEIDNEDLIVPFPGQVHMSYDITEFSEIIQKDDIDIIKFHRMPPGFVAIIRTCSDKGAAQKQCFIDLKLDELSGLKQFQDLDLETLNYALYKCDEEEKDSTEGKRGAYQIEGVPMVYAGIASVKFLIRSLKESQNLGSPLFNNVRDGDWLIDYILDRYRDHEGTKFLVPVLEDIFTNIK